VSANGGSAFLVLLSALADLREVILTAENTASEPHGEALDHVLGNTNLDRFGSLACEGLVLLEALVNALLHLPVEALVEVIEKSASSRKHNVLVELSASINGA